LAAHFQRNVERLNRLSVEAENDPDSGTRWRNAAFPPEYEHHSAPLATSPWSSEKAIYLETADVAFVLTVLTLQRFNASTL
jgi:hypothetical protein